MRISACSNNRNFRKTKKSDIKMTAVEETFKKLSSIKGVTGIAIYNHDGVCIKTTLDTAMAEHYGSLISSLTSLARSSIHDLDSTNDLTFIRIRSKKHEIMVAPDKDFLLLVLQKPPTQC